ncbi:SDR family oxidoreductase [Terriglobus sp. RCC_193]|uniref:SDR family oxidoreductase n=1 Tax=Terriglobus sp. RCC_193 TaxID=3239218 RepID=UPI0035253BB0
MQIKGNTILITGGGSGIGRGLAEAFHKEGNRVIIAGRRKSVLDEVVAANPGMNAEILDIDSADAVKSFANSLIAKYPNLNAVMHNAGVMRNEKLADGNTEDAEATIATNLLGPIRLNSALLPHLLQQPSATVMTVTSGLAYVPLSMTPTYCATKAAIHSYTQSLRFQLKDTGVQVIEIIPPYVQTELMGDRQKNDPAAMPLADYLRETFAILRDQPDVEEVIIDRVKPLRFAAEGGDYATFFRTFNERMIAARPNG